MWKLNEFLSAETNAHYLFPYQEKIEYKEYRVFLFLYFKALKKIEDKNSYFFTTYFSNGEVTWFVYKEYRYFIISMYSKISGEDRYYGKHILNINL